MWVKTNFDRLSLTDSSFCMFCAGQITKRCLATLLINLAERRN